LRNFGIVSGTAVALMFGLVFPFFRHSALPLWPWAVAGVLWFSAFVYPPVLKPLQQVMHFVGSRLINLINWVVLAIFYFLILAPYSYFLRAAGKISVHKSFNSDAVSYRIVPAARQKTDMGKPF